MNIEKTALEGVYIINNFVAQDERGTFVKTFNKQDFENNKLNFEIRESYYSISKKDVIRGMHFQLPPSDHEKLVYVPCGSIIDVVVDLRKKSLSYKKFIAVELTAENRKSIYIPKGLAHGFQSMEDNTITVYNVGTEYNSKSDQGIKFDSFGFDWQANNIIMSSRDKEFMTLDSFCENNPF
ncbi:MAG TPA: dTDP-4-dehydrorhamnose 3,5-epimerase [Lutibacter sp.]|nr:dTDP-4-dehydrorhamnose 3,5-epimerase [Lutibacter sp.]